MRPDGSRLTGLPAHESPLSPIDVLPDGRLIAYYNSNTDALYVSRADGSGRRRVQAFEQRAELQLTVLPGRLDLAIVRSARG